MAQLVKNLLAKWETWVRSLGSIPGLKGMATHSSILVGEFYGLQSPWGHKESDMTEWLSLSNHSYPPTGYTINQRGGHKSLHGSMWCPIRPHTHFLKSVLSSSPQYPTWTLSTPVREGTEEAGCVFHEWHVLFVAAKGLNHPGIWGMWSPSPESWKILGSGEFLPRDRNLQSVHTEHANDRACDAYSSLELPAAFKYFLHITIISCIICLTFPRWNLQACNPRLPALGGRHDLASSGPAILGDRAGGRWWGARCTEERPSSSKPAGGRTQLWGLGSLDSCSEHLKCRVLVSGISAQTRSDWLLFMDAQISSWILWPHQTSCELSNILSPAPFYSNLQKWILEMTVKIFA